MSFTPFPEFHHRIQLQVPTVVAGLILYWPPCLPWIASLPLCRQAFSVCFWTLSLWIYFWRNQIKTSTCLQRAKSLLGKMRLGKNRRGEWREGEERVGSGKDRLCGKCYHVGQRYFMLITMMFSFFVYGIMSLGKPIWFIHPTKIYCMPTTCQAITPEQIKKSQLTF